MSYKISKDGIKIKVDSENEFKVVIDMLLKDSNKTPIPPNQLPDKSTTHAMNSFFKSLSLHTNQYKALLALKNNPDGLTANQLMQEIGLAKGQALGGTIGNFTKKARKFGLRSSDIYTMNTESQQLRYRLTDEMLKVIENTTK